MLSWQRTAFHFQPMKNWMNDPNGPLFYKGWYHLFYQYNPESAVWGNIVWGHAVSRDLIHWRHLPIAMVPDHWYDANGVWTGSATFLPDGQLLMLYTGATNDYVQVQNLAYPEDLSDPLLLKWVKYEGNPVLVPPSGIGSRDFRDPTTAWYSEAQGRWHIMIGSKINRTGITMVFDTEDFKHFRLVNGLAHGVAGTGMWECVDFYPVSTTEGIGLDTSYVGPNIKHVLKTSLDDDRNDYYALGTYQEPGEKWRPDDPTIDAGIGLRYDYGTYYASKSFYDPSKKRRVNWGWITEIDSETSDLQKGWASLQGIPRTILFDNKTGTNLIQWPVEEVEKLRGQRSKFEKVEVKPGSVVQLDVGKADELDIVAEFEVEKDAFEKAVGSDIPYSCAAGAAQRGVLGPFGLLVIAKDDFSEHTPIYFYIAKDTKGNFKTFFCADHLRSSLANDVRKITYGSTVSVLDGENFSVRILVDHSIVESFGQGGRTCITSRIYPTSAVGEDAKVFVFNNATDATITASVEIWQMSEMDSAAPHNFNNWGTCTYIIFIVFFFLL
ncbi:acid beta-fructofuranosidase 2, vacuolar-like [Ipomoea triloba]|nr:acid beta-fructofuranosidase 2, vacuolar-like [Ipomoea triloba]